ncbi:phosphatase PAP2 family protein [Pseudonocardia aurantiaca]|uniref:Phosphatase PAP2 family protein n=1 Tax=Pseudonocardia aurantiaca TaxID=75290 RepID=A0ABW4FUX0_9PSEU
MSAGVAPPEQVALPPALRGPAAVVVALSTLVFASLAARYGGESTGRWLDDRLQSLVGSSGRGRSLSDVVIAFGNEISVVVVALLLSGLAFALGQRRLAVLIVVGPGLTGLATTTLKPVVGRTLNDQFAFPSGHAGGATALGVVTALLLISVLRTAGRASATLLAAGALLSGGTMAVALIADRDHYPTDTIGGFCVAVAVVLTSALVIDWSADRIGRRAGPAGSTK